MAGHYELDNFVRKFVSLWQSGCEASLHVESKAGNAFISLQLGLGQAHVHPHAGGRRGGGLARQRRRERREAERLARAASEQDVGLDDGKIDAEQAESEQEEVVSEEENHVGSVIPQLDGNADDKVVNEFVEYELQIKAHNKCKNYDVIEAIEVNFDGILDDMKVEENDTNARYILVQKVDRKVKFNDREAEPDDEEKHILMYRVFIRNCEVSQNVVESWKNRYKFDDLAFGNAVHGKVNVRILEVVKL